MNSSLAKAKLKDVCKIEKGKIGITKAIEGEYQLVVTAEERSSHNEWHFDEPATIVPLVSSTGHGHASIKRLHYAEGKYAVGNILATLIPKDHKYLNAKYLYVYLTINKEELLVSQMTGAANVSLTLTRLAEVEIEVPDYETQLKVIKKYEDAQRYKNSMNSQIETRSELIEKLRQQILQDAITGKLSEKWRKENPNIESAEVLLEKIKTEKEKLVKEGKIRKQKPLPPITEIDKPFELPEGWVWCRLGEVVELYQGLAINAKTKHMIVDQGILPLLRIKDLTRGTEEQYIDPNLAPKQTLVNKEDILYTRTGQIGLVFRGRTGVLHNNSFKVIPASIISNDYLYWWLQNPLFRRDITILASKTAQPDITHKLFKQQLICLPTFTEQKYIVESIEPLFSKLNNIRALNIDNQEIAEMLNRILIQEMFTE